MTKKCSIFILTLLLLSFTGCRTKPIPPRPSDTVGTGQSNERVDWVGANQFYGSDVPELRGRGLNSDMGDIGDTPISAIYFDYMESIIKGIERTKLQEIAEQLVADPELRVLIVGHCDWRGTAEYNLGLGDRRANSVKNFLITLGVFGERLETNTKGDIESIVEGTEEEMALDRRAVLFPIR